MSTAAPSEDSPSPPNSSGSETASEIPCSEAQRLTSAFVHGGLPAKAGLLLRRHLSRCEECRKGYREALTSVGRLGASLRESKRPQTGPEPKRERHERLVKLASQTNRGNKSARRFRAILLIAGLIAACIGLTRYIAFDEPIDVIWVSGRVGVGDFELSSALATAKMYPADWCWTGENSKARLTYEGTSIEIGGKTQLLVENREGPSFNLRTGSLLIDGSGEVLTSRGHVRAIEGLVGIRIKARRLVLESFGGRLELVTPSGVRSVGPGEPALIVE